MMGKGETSGTEQGAVAADGDDEVAVGNYRLLVAFAVAQSRRVQPDDRRPDHVGIVAGEYCQHGLQGVAQRCITLFRHDPDPSEHTAHSR
jgi:hypothetical protein